MCPLWSEKKNCHIWMNAKARVSFFIYSRVCVCWMNFEFLFVENFQSLSSTTNLAPFYTKCMFFPFLNWWWWFDWIEILTHFFYRKKNIVTFVSMCLFDDNLIWFLSSQFIQLFDDFVTTIHYYHNFFLIEWFIDWILQYIFHFVCMFC